MMVFFLFLVHLIVAHSGNGKQHQLKNAFFKAQVRGGAFHLAFDKSPAFLSLAAFDTTVLS